MGTVRNFTIISQYIDKLVTSFSYHIWLWSAISVFLFKVINVFLDPLESKVKIKKSYEEKKQ